METISYVQQFASPTLDTVFQFITNLGAERAYIAFLLITYLAVDARVGQRVGIYLLAGFYLNFQLKGIFDTPRPFELNPALARSQEAIETAGGAGFPSGHAQGSVIFWGYLASVFARVWFWLVALLLILLISLSRIYLGVHLPVDVLGGLLIGAVFVVLARALDYLLRDAKPLPLWGVLLLGLGLPLALHLLWPVAGSDMLLGGLAAFATGPSLFPYSAKNALWKRLVIALLGLILVFVVLLGSSLLLPEAVKDHPLGGFVRYLLIGYTGVLLTPWLAQRLRLAEQGAPSPATTSSHYGA